MLVHKLAGALLLPSRIGPMLGHGVHEPPITVAKGSLPNFSTSLPLCGSLDSVAGETWLLNSDPLPKLLKFLALDCVLRDLIC